MPQAASDADQFWAEFNSEITLLQSSIIGAAQPSDMVALKDKHVEMQTYATNSALVLANYDLKRAQEILEATSKSLKEKENQVQPRKKFTFKSKQMLFEKMRAEAVAAKSRGMGSKTTQEQAQTGTGDPESNDETLYIVKNKEGEKVVLTTEMIGVANGVMRALLIRNCKGVTLFARCALGAVRIENCEDCRVFLGPCSTSVYLDSIIRGSVFICCHQLRIHKSKDVQLYVRVNGHPIIEDCAGMGFAPYQVVYPQLEADLAATGLVEAKCWDNVIDFRWHRSTQSPNWVVLAPEERAVYEVVRSSSGDGDTIWGEERAAKAGSGDGDVTSTSTVLPPAPPLGTRGDSLQRGLAGMGAAASSSSSSSSKPVLVPGSSSSSHTSETTGSKEEDGDKGEDEDEDEDEL